MFRFKQSIVFGNLRLLILANTAFGLAQVFYNAYLPVLVDADPDVARLRSGASMFMSRCAG